MSLKTSAILCAIATVLALLSEIGSVYSVYSTIEYWDPIMLVGYVPTWFFYTFLTLFLLKFQSRL